MLCSHFRENFLNELTELISVCTKREINLIFSRDSKMSTSYPYCRYAYSCRYISYDCPVFPSKKLVQLTLF